MENIKNVDGFLFAIIDEETATERLKNCESFYVLHEDGTKSQAEDENDINTALNFGEKFGIEIGFLKDLEKEFEEAKTPFKETTDHEEVKKLINMFLDWKNNFLTVGRFAEYYSLTIEKANEIIDKGRQLNEISTN